MVALYIGLMSGTSLDGVDAVVAEFGDGSAPLVHAHHHLPMPAGLRQDLLALNSSGPDELHRAALAANGLAELYHEATTSVLRNASLAAADIRAVGAHGQTVRHRPQAFGGTGYTLQLLNGALLAERCGIDVVCDFRSRDVAAGGQGAPLVPAFHTACFGRPGETLAVLNLGGMANLSLLHADGRVGGFDCGPANVLLDLWCQRHQGQAYDADGAWAASGQVMPALVAHWLAEPFFALPPPKSTGRDLFDGAWLDRQLAAFGRPTRPEDVQASLLELTASSCAQALLRHGPATTRLLACGGGALNRQLMSRLASQLPGIDFVSTAEAGLPPMQVEAAAFAWLARAFIEGVPANLPAVTGAAGLRRLGALYPAD